MSRSRWRIDIRKWGEPPGPWLKLYYYQRKPYALRKMDELIRLHFSPHLRSHHLLNGHPRLEVFRLVDLRNEP